MQGSQSSINPQEVEEEKPGQHLLVCPTTGLLEYGEKVEVNEANENQYAIWSRKKKFEIQNENAPGVKETLNAIFPPKTWDKEGRKFYQYISYEPGTRARSKSLYNDFEKKLKERKARESGICNIREQVFSELFDELIRQVAIECPERGLLLLKVRDEIKNNIASYQILYESALLFGTRKQVQAEKGKIRSLEKLEEMKKKRIELLNKKAELENKYASLKRLVEERQIQEDERRKNEIKFLTDQENSLKEILNNIMSNFK